MSSTIKAGYPAVSMQATPRSITSMIVRPLGIDTNHHDVSSYSFWSIGYLVCSIITCGDLPQLKAINHLALIAEPQDQVWM